MAKNKDESNESGWTDRTLYWAWYGNDGPETLPPTAKRIEYATVTGPGVYLNGDGAGKRIVSYLAVGVFDGDKYTPINRGDGFCELGWHIKHGSKVEIPKSEKNE